MKNVLVLLGILIFSGFSSSSFAMCAVNDDWPEAPCFDVLPVNRDEYRQAWAPYYDYKGSEWMEQKKAEMLNARDGGTLSEWISGSAHHNVFSYYLSRGEIAAPPPYDRPFFEDDFMYHLQFFAPGQGWLFFAVLGISAGLLVSIVIFLVRRKQNDAKK